MVDRVAFDALGLPCWIDQALSRPVPEGGCGFLGGALPIQATVIPKLLSLLRSPVAADACIAAPTGSGKTLCYLAPLMSQVREAKAAAGGFTLLRGIVVVPTHALVSQVAGVAEQLARNSPTPIEIRALSDSSSSLSGSSAGGGPGRTAVSSSTTSGVFGAFTRSVRSATGMVRRYVTADIVVATPHRLLNELLDDASDISCAQVASLIFDEADTVLGGTFTSLARRIASIIDRDAQECGAITHKVLCSATLTEHLAKVAEVQLRNVAFLTLNKERAPLGTSDVKAQQKTSSGNAAETSAPRALLSGVATVTSRIALPEGLHERFVIVEDETRHASLVKVVAAALQVGRELQHAKTPEDLDRLTQQASSSGSDLPSTTRLVNAGTTLVFCASPASARLLAHMFTGMQMRCVSLTAAITPAERAAAMTAAYSGEPCVVVATDSIMRGVDLPGVSVVVMYDCPTSLQQYIHRAGRTARGGGDGVVVALLSKVGPSGSQDDGEVATFKALEPFLQRPADRKPTQLVAFRRVASDFTDRVTRALNHERPTTQLPPASTARSAQKKRSRDEE